MRVCLDALRPLLHFFDALVTNTRSGKILKQIFLILEMEVVCTVIVSGPKLVDVMWDFFHICV